MSKLAFLLMAFGFLAACFNLNGPKLRWHAPIASDETPIIHNGKVYISGFPAGQPGEPKRLYALDALTGKQRWVCPDPVKLVYGASGSYVFFKNQADHLLQLDAETGEVLHESTDTEASILNWIIRGDTMFIINASLEVVAVDNRANKVLWRRQLPNGPYNSSDLQLAGNKLIASLNIRQDQTAFGMIWALNMDTGEEIWHFESPPPRDYDPLEITVYGDYVLATNTSPLGLYTHVLDLNSGQEKYAPIGVFDIYGCLGDTIYGSNGNYSLQTGQRAAGGSKWISGCVINGIAWQRRIGSGSAFSSFFLRSTYDGDVSGSRNWTDVPPDSSIEGFDIRKGKLRYQTREYRYTRFSTPVIEQGVLFHSSLAIMKEGKSGVWAYRLPQS